MTTTPQRQVGAPDGNLVLDLFVLQQRIGELMELALAGTGVRPAEYAVYSQLGIAPGAEVLALVRLRGMNSTPICVDRNVIPLAVAHSLVEVDLTDASLYESLQNHCGVRIFRSAYSVQAEAASAEITGLLRTLNLERSLTLLIVTHDPAVGAATDRIIRMVDGAVAGEDAPHAAEPPVVAARS